MSVQSDIRELENLNKRAEKGSFDGYIFGIVQKWIVSGKNATSKIKLKDTEEAEVKPDRNLRVITDYSDINYLLKNVFEHVDSIAEDEIGMSWDLYSFSGVPAVLERDEEFDESKLYFDAGVLASAIRNANRYKDDMENHKISYKEAAFMSNRMVKKIMTDIEKSAMGSILNDDSFEDIYDTIYKVFVKNLTK